MSGNPPKPFTSIVSKWFFAVCILFVLYLTYSLLQPFIIPIFLAVIATVVSLPLYRLFKRVFKGSKVVASVCTCLVLTLIIVIPFLLIAGIITNQALSLYNYISSLILNNEMEDTLRQLMDYIAPLWETLQNSFGVSQQEVAQQVGDLLGKASNFLYVNVLSLVRGFGSLILNFVLILFVTFYLLMDGRRMAVRLLSLSPLPGHLNSSITSDILRSLRTTMKSTMLLATLQGVAGGLGLWIAGVPNSPFWGTLMVFASVVPIVGIALVWVPAVIYLLIMGQVLAPILLAIWCLLVGLSCDNVLRPKLLGQERGIHPLLTFFSVLGGLSLYGMVGLFIGPLILAVLISLLEVYERYFLNPQALDQYLPIPSDKNQASALRSDADSAGEEKTT